MVELSNLIKVYDNSLEDAVCSDLIDKFEGLKEYHQRIDNNRKPNFTQLNLTELCKNDNDLNTIHQILVSKTLTYKNEYSKFFNEVCFPDEYFFEQFRIKRYLNDGNDVFEYHIDVTDHLSAKRFLSFMWYLNDVDKGGETVFNELVIKPKIGRLVIFPPLWMFPHMGKPPISGNKYIISTYLHYK